MPQCVLNMFESLTLIYYTEGNILFRFEYPIRMVPGLPFRQSVISADTAYFIVCTVDKANKDCLAVYSATNGTFVSKILLKGCGIKVSLSKNIWRTTKK